jgi:pyruvate-formate lyase-activating enzyme
MNAKQATAVKTWCVNPFLQAHQLMNGNLTPCCLYRTNTMGKDIDEYINSQELKNLKQNLVSGIQDAGCQICWKEEKSGLISKRQQDNKTYSQRFQLIYNKKELLEPNPELAEYYIRLGNNCNLRCVTCNDRLSTGWGSENKKYGLPYAKKNNIKKSDPIWSHMIGNVRFIKLIEFIGGEPLMIDINSQVEFLKKVIETGHSKNIKLRYHTNGTKFNNDIAELWQYFNEVTIWISIDGVERSFEYIRYPAKWAVLNSNLEKFFALSSQCSNIKIKTNCTVSVLNVFNLSEILNWFNNVGLEYHLNFVHFPQEYSLSCQEPMVKEKITQYLQGINANDANTILKIVNTSSTTFIPVPILIEKLTQLDQKRSLQWPACLELVNVLKPIVSSLDV